MQQQASFSARRDRLSGRLADLARTLANPTRQNVELVRNELERLARG